MRAPLRLLPKSYYSYGISFLVEGRSPSARTIPGAVSQARWTRGGCRGLRGDPAHSLAMRATRELIVEMQCGLGNDHLDCVSGLALFGLADAGDLPDDLHPMTREASGLQSTLR